MTLAVDVIGDVHGQFDKLTALLTHLGYRDGSGPWRHPDRIVVFVGDLIDRGPKQLATVELVRAMVDAGTARCVCRCGWIWGACARCMLAGTRLRLICCRRLSDPVKR